MLAVNSLPLITRNGIHPTAKLLRDPSNKTFRSFSTVQSKLEKLIVSSADTNYDVPDSGVPILNQLNLGACVLHSTTRALMTALFIEQQKVIQPSRLFAYWLCSKAMGTVGQDTGTYVSMAVERYGSIGICDEAIWQYTDDPSTFYVPPSNALEAVLEGSDNRPTAWVKIDETDAATKLGQMEIALRANHTIAFGTPVDASIQNYVAGQVLTLPDSTKLLGGHSLQLTGVHYIRGARVWRFANSWDVTWGDNGYGLLDDKWASDPNFADLWIMSRLDNLLF